MEQDAITHPGDLSSIREMLRSSGYAEKAIDYYLTKPLLPPLSAVISSPVAWEYNRLPS